MSNSVLIINNMSGLPVLANLLDQAGFSVETVTDTYAGLQRFDRRAYDIAIILEKATADCRGICEKIRARSGSPIIVISPDASTEACARAIQAGADFFMRKPFGPLEFLARINALLQRTPVRQLSPASCQS